MYNLTNCRVLYTGNGELLQALLTARQEHWAHVSNADDSLLGHGAAHRRRFFQVVVRIHTQDTISGTQREYAVRQQVPPPMENRELIEGVDQINYF